VLALVNATITPAAARALARERSWQLNRVELVSKAVESMSADQRKSVRALIIEAEPVGDTLLAQLSSLELIACLRSDPVNVDVAAATRRGIPVVHTPGRNAEAVADFTLGLCLAAARGIAIAHHQIVSDRLTTAAPSLRINTAPGDAIWRPDDPADPIPYVIFRGRELSGLIVGVVGFGAVGQAVARRFGGLVHAVHVADPAISADTISGCGFIPASLNDLLPIADVLTIHARSATVVIGRDQLRQMKPGSILINTARATVLDYDALSESLESGHLRAAALDVFPLEPIPAASPLLRQKNLTLTPHIAGATVEVGDRQSEIMLAAVRGLYGTEGWSGLPVRNPQLYERWTAEQRARAGEPV